MNFSGLTAKHLSKTYNGRLVVRNLSLNITQGEAVGLLGPNGAGKTTSFSMIAGLLTPDQGEIYLENDDISNLPMHIRATLGIGYLPQESSIFRGLNVAENIMLVLEVNYKDVEYREHRLEELLAEFSISHLRYVPATALSGGERRRLEIARCLAINPKFILLDEPLAGIDPIAVQDLKGLIVTLKAKNIGLLITDHNVRTTLEIVDRAYIMYDGEILQSGTPAEVIACERVRKLYLGQEYKPHG